jgi:hypothetical protein
MTEPTEGSAGDAATLDGLPGRGYGVVESLQSLGKGRQLTGLFRTAPAHAARLAAHVAARRRVPFEGFVHFRHHSVRTTVQVEVERVSDEDGELLVELTAYDVPYSLG